MELVNEWRMPFQHLRNIYKEMQIYYSPLLEPIDKIESRLRDSNYLSERQHLIRFDADKEEFVIGSWADEYVKLTWKEKFKLWLLRK